MEKKGKGKGSKGGSLSDKFREMYQNENNNKRGNGPGRTVYFQ